MPQGARAEVTPVAPTTGAQTVQAERTQTSASVQANPAQKVQGSAQTHATQVNVCLAQADADLAYELIASGATTQPIETVVAVLAATREGASINAAAKASAPRTENTRHHCGHRACSATIGHLLNQSVLAFGKGPAKVDGVFDFRPGFLD